MIYSMQNNDQDTTQPVYVSLEFTPNPNTLKYSVNRTLLDKGALNFTDKTDAEKKSPLAFKLMNVPGISSVMLGRDFVTVSKAEEGDWDVVHRTASDTIEAHLNANEAVVIGEALEKVKQYDASSIEQKIQDVLDAEIRPAVANDGGDVTLDRFEDGIVYLFMRGACAGCPSSSATLKMGIETRLKEAIPEVIEVVSA